MNADLTKIAKINFEKDVFNLMNYAVFGKTMENMRKHRHIKFVTTKKIYIYIFGVRTILSYCIFLTEHLVPKEMKKH